MKKMKIFRVLLLIFWCIVIFAFSHDVGESSSKKSDLVTEAIVDVYDKVTDQKVDRDSESMEIWHHAVRKVAHFFLYFVLGICAFICFYSLSFNFRKLFCYCLIFCVCYAVFDEIHQLFISDRNGSFIDVFVDTTGSICGILVSFWTFKHILQSNLFVKKFDKMEKFC